MFVPLTSTERFDRRPWLVGTIILSCVVAFVWMRLGASPLAAAPPLALDPLSTPSPSPSPSPSIADDPFHGFAFRSFDQPAGLVTYMFAHADWLHLGGNMFFLWTFGRLIEGRWGRVATALCFVVTGAAGAALHALSRPGAGAPLVGASGAIAGLAGAVVVALPNARYDRLFSPLFWPATPFVALRRGRGWAALLELIPFYGWILRVPRGLPAFYVLPAWLSLDLVSMMVFPGARTSHACHVGGALAGIGFAVLMRVTRWPERLTAAGPTSPVPDADPGVAPAVLRLREARRASRFPEGRLAGVWFAVSLAGAALLSIGTVALGEALAGARERREAAAWRTRLEATSPLADATFDLTYDQALFSVTYPSAFWTCGRDQAAEGPCVGRKNLDNPNAGALELLRPDAYESIQILALRNAVDKKSELVAMVADEFARKLKNKVKWRVVESQAGTCRGEWSVESVIQLGEGDTSFHMWSCTFSNDLDLYHVSYVVPEPLRERDAAVLERIVRSTTLPAAAKPEARLPLPAATADWKPPLPTARLPTTDDAPTDCPPGTTPYHLDGKLHCSQAEVVPGRAGAGPSPHRRIPLRR